MTQNMLILLFQADETPTYTQRHIDQHTQTHPPTYEKGNGLRS